VTAEDVIAALDLPASARLDRRVPKKLLLENGAPTATDRKAINDGVDELRWIAALKATTIGVPPYSDDVREYLEIAVLQLTTRPETRTARLASLVHRAVPYPVLLVIGDERHVVISTAHKRLSLGEAGKTVLDDEGVAIQLDEPGDAAWLPTFLDSLALASQPRTSILAVYQGWIDTLIALMAARVTGQFVVLHAPVEKDARREAISDYARVTTEMASLRKAAARETQLPRQVETNQELARLRATQSEARAKL
jgi:hypothetical protein